MSVDKHHLFQGFAALQAGKNVAEQGPQFFGPGGVEDPGEPLRHHPVQLDPERPPRTTGELNDYFLKLTRTDEDGHYDETPESFARKLGRFVEQGWLVRIRISDPAERANAAARLTRI